MIQVKGIFFVKGIIFRAIILGISLLLFSCSKEKPVKLAISVKDKDRSSGVPAATVELFRSTEGGQAIRIDSLSCDETGHLPLEILVEKGYRYKLVASKAYYEASLGGGGASFANEKQFSSSDLPKDTIKLYLKAMVSMPTSEDLQKQASTNVNELIGNLKGGNWVGNFIPRLQWEDIPTLLEQGGDSTVIQHFPMKTGSKLKPDSARIGQVMLWMVEAIRKDAYRKVQDKPIFLMPPSNVPVLGTRRGNPRLFNSKGALKKAHEAYLKWWENGPPEDTLKKARRNPLRGTGLGWM